MPRNSPRPGTPPGIRSNCALAPLPAPIAPVPIDGRRKPRYHILITLGQRDKPLNGDWINAFYASNTLYIHESVARGKSIALREYTHHALDTVLGAPHPQT